MNSRRGAPGGDVSRPQGKADPVPFDRRRTLFAATAPVVAAILALAGPACAAGADGLLFRLSADKSLTADMAGGEAVPNFADHARIVATGFRGGAVSADDEVVLAWKAAGNIYADRGTLSFFWRSRYPVGEAPFPIFRVGFADHSSWDMAWLRIDWNGSRASTRLRHCSTTSPAPRVSFKLPGKALAAPGLDPPGLHLGRDARRRALRRRQEARRETGGGSPSTIPASTSSAPPAGWSPRTRYRAATTSIAAATTTSCASTTARPRRRPADRRARQGRGAPALEAVAADHPRRVGVPLRYGWNRQRRPRRPCSAPQSPPSERSSSPTLADLEGADVEGHRSGIAEVLHGPGSITARACPAATTTSPCPTGTSTSKAARRSHSPCPRSPGTTSRSRARPTATWPIRPRLAPHRRSSPPRARGPGAHLQPVRRGPAPVAC